MSNKTTTHNAIPKLRFPEFRDNIEYSKLNKIFDLRNGYTPSKSKLKYWTNGTIPWFRMEDIRKNGRILDDSIQHITKEAVKTGKLFPANSIVIATTATIGEHALITVDSLANQRFTFLIKKVNCSIYINIKFFFYYCYILGNWCRNNTNKGGFESVQMDRFRKIRIPIPQKKEQQKIADCLSSIDDLITAQTQKVETLKAHKKGLMQQLFPAEGETVPTLRFPEFQNAGAWEKTHLGDLCSKARSGGTPKSTIKEYYDGDIPFLAISDMTKQGKYLTSTSKKISQFGIDNSVSWIVPINTIIYSMYASVGFVSINKIPLATSQAVINLTIKNGYFIEFIYYHLVELKKNIHKFIETGTQGNLNAEIVKSLILNIPSYTEQQKIADCLSSLDDLITAQTQKVETLKSHKKGLMQQLFI